MCGVATPVNMWSAGSLHLLVPDTALSRLLLLSFVGSRLPAYLQIKSSTGSERILAVVSLLENKRTSTMCCVSVLSTSLQGDCPVSLFLLCAPLLERFLFPLSLASTVLQSALLVPVMGGLVCSLVEFSSVRSECNRHSIVIYLYFSLPCSSLLLSALLSLHLSSFVSSLPPS